MVAAAVVVEKQPCANRGGRFWAETLDQRRPSIGKAWGADSAACSYLYCVKNKYTHSNTENTNASGLNATSLRKTFDHITLSSGDVHRMVDHEFPWEFYHAIKPMLATGHHRVDLPGLKGVTVKVELREKHVTFVISHDRVPLVKCHGCLDLSAREEVWNAITTREGYGLWHDVESEEFVSRLKCPAGLFLAVEFQMGMAFPFDFEVLEKIANLEQLIYWGFLVRRDFANNRSDSPDRPTECATLPSDVLTIQNAGQAIKATNYWGSQLEREGFVFVSFNAGAARILVPSGRPDIVVGLTSKVKHAILTFGRWQERESQPALEWLAEDGSDTPFSLQIASAGFDRTIKVAPGQVQRIVASIWVDGPNGPHLYAQQVGFVRKREMLPCLEAIAAAN